MRSLRARSHNFISPLKDNRNFIERALYHAVSPRRSKLSAGKTIGETQYFIVKLVHNLCAHNSSCMFYVNPHASVRKVSIIKDLIG